MPTNLLIVFLTVACAIWFVFCTILVNGKAIREGTFNRLPRWTLLVDYLCTTWLLTWLIFRFL
jgi:hypothetical protein